VYQNVGRRRGLPERPKPKGPRTILFYERSKPYYGFTNFSPHTVTYKKKAYPTSEHLFQAWKVGCSKQETL
jgi:predicted NAD-dependent protein-ADP-ribosyltransferase YbiA (DUF1768 family)